MNVLFVSGSEDAGDWLAVISDDTHLITWHTTIESAEEDLDDESFDFAIVDVSLPDGPAIYSLHRMKELAPKLDIFVRFDRTGYDTRTYEGLIAAGAKGMFVGWPTIPILEHEVRHRNGDVVVSHLTHGTVQILDQNLLVNGQSYKLTSKECKMLSILLRAKGKVVTRKRLLLQTGYSLDTNSHTIETHIYRIRQKAKEAGLENFVITRDGGYCVAMS